jgi:NAD(P)H-hydrate epimerase
MKLVSGKKMAEIDKYAINRIGIPGSVLMENAGKGVFNEFLIKFAPEKNASILIICGKGNNGGDGFVVARYLFNNGFSNFKIILLAQSNRLKGDALINFQICKNIGISVDEAVSYEDFTKITENKNFDFIFDAVLGTGLNSKVRDFYEKIINYINTNKGVTISIDIPSGLDSEKGIPLGNSVKANLTCTFAYKKIGLSTYPGFLYAGDVKVIDISIPENRHFTFETFETDENIVKNIYKQRNISGHKGTFGHAVVIGGSAGFTGAPFLSAKAALKAGAGLVTSVIPQDINIIMESMFAEAMTYPVNLKNFDKNALLDFINAKNAVLIGPGMGTSDESKNFFFDIAKYINVPVVIDADGLNILAKDIGYLEKFKQQIVITPHPGEMSRLCSVSVKEIQENRVAIAKEFAKKYGISVVLKGARTVITNGNETYINPTGSNAIATGGSGDVLSGMILSFLAQGYTMDDASVIGAYLHGLAGEVAEKKLCKESVIASDIIDNLHFAFKIIL